MRELGAHSWEEILTPEERLGGPSRMGSSKYDAFKRGCPYFYWFRYVKRMTLEELNPNLEIGGLFHECRARYYQTEMDLRDKEEQQYIDEACLDVSYDLLRRAEDVAPETVAPVRRLWKGWVNLRGPGTPDDDRRDTIAVEVLLESKKPFLYTTRLDRVCQPESIDDHCNIHEIKTAKAYSERLRQSYKMDSQFLGQQYLWFRSGAQQKYGPLKNYVIDLAIKTNPAHYPQEIAPISMRLLNDWAFEMEYVWTRIQYFTRSAKQWPRNRTYNCRFCDAFEHCASGGRSTAGWRRKKKDEF